MPQMKNKKLCCCRGTARRVTWLQILWQWPWVWATLSLSGVSVTHTLAIAVPQSTWIPNLKCLASWISNLRRVPQIWQWVTWYWSSQFRVVCHTEFSTCYGLPTWL